MQISGFNESTILENEFRKMLRSVDLKRRDVINYETSLENFNAFKSYFKYEKQETDEQAQSRIGNMVQDLMNRILPGESFQLEIIEISQTGSGAFDTILRGSKHIIKIRAYVDIETGGGHPAQYKVDVRVEKTQTNSLFGICCCCWH